MKNTLNLPSNILKDLRRVYKRTAPHHKQDYLYTTSEGLLFADISTFLNQDAALGLLVQFLGNQKYNEIL